MIIFSHNGITIHPVLPEEKPAMPTNPARFVIGLMAGTSVDGIDASLVETDGERLTASGHAVTLPYRAATRDRIFAAMEAPDAPRADLDAMIADDHAEAVEEIIAMAGRHPDLIGFHGQTIFHDPGRGVTIQAGSAERLAARVGVPVFHRFRQADIAAGGQGAPLAPIYHQALINALGCALPAAIANIGGITNITRWDGQRLTGFDTGPGNALMDQLARLHLNADYDHDGQLAAAGQADKAWVEAVLADPYFSLDGPKSLDRSIVLGFADSLPSGTPADQMASGALLTALALARAAAGTRTLIVCGGGARNPVLMAMIRAATNAQVSTMEDHGLDGDFIEAELMAFLAERSRRGLPITFPGTTGVKAPLTGGAVALPSDQRIR